MFDFGLANLRWNKRMAWWVVDLWCGCTVCVDRDTGIVSRSLCYSHRERDLERLGRVLGDD